MLILISATTPEILGIDPEFGPVAGGTLITIFGRNLQGDSDVQLLLNGLVSEVISR